MPDSETCEIRVPLLICASLLGEAPFPLRLQSSYNL